MPPHQSLRHRHTVQPAAVAAVLCPGLFNKLIPLLVAPLKNARPQHHPYFLIFMLPIINGMS